jgi:neutral trehalase
MQNWRNYYWRMASDLNKDEKQNHWPEVKTRILETCHHSKVDSSSWQMPGSLKLPFPYFSIHEGRSVLFCWDTYFTNAGLLLTDSLAVYAKNAVDNQFAEIEQIGFVPNASEPWGLNRSQTPFGFSDSLPVKEKLEMAEAWLSEAETMDFTPRFENRCHQFVAVDLNANLFQPSVSWLVIRCVCLVHELSGN